jgi:hypothetical protein
MQRIVRYHVSTMRQELIVSDESRSGGIHGLPVYRTLAQGVHHGE